MAALRAKTMQRMTNKNIFQWKFSGNCFAARVKPMIAKGNAKTVCENFMREKYLNNVIGNLKVENRNQADCISCFSNF